ncbi:hypothetical protein Srubr_01220 [Streptomyces rubradiris]|uniref:Uncharacterized protein n=1 Tax=Streptomyces rubradiris TaxID=285531 RepID=A0ABQ3R334_STRRR|nr:hypothetical protein GCM10018792_16670 [Streptomyces rubradiris]GHI50276.1 hypothetical protein Srubr_01220 [Streptomyces rubradiris]
MAEPTAASSRTGSTRTHHGGGAPRSQPRSSRFPRDHRPRTDPTFPSYAAAGFGRPRGKPVDDRPAARLAWARHARAGRKKEASVMQDSSSRRSPLPVPRACHV